MSSITSTELSITPEEMDNTRKPMNVNNSNLILENNSGDVTISKFESSNSYHSITPSPNPSIKTQVLPLLYIQNSNKIPYATVNKTTNNVIVNNIPQLQFASLSSTLTKNVAATVTSISLPTNPNLIFATSRTQPIVFQKSAGNVLPVVPVPVAAATKITGTYLTMLKSFQKPTDTTIQVANNNINKIQDISLINNNTYVQSQNKQQKILLTPMPKLTSNRLPTTATTNCLKTKFAILPMPVPNTEPTATKKVYNFTGQVLSDTSHVTTMCENFSNENSLDADSNSENLVCDEVLEADSPDKNDVSNKTYELSIVEESVSSQSDLRGSVILTTSKETPRFAKHGVSILKKTFNLDRKVDKPDNSIVSSNPNTIPETKNISGKSDEDSIIITIPAKPEKERRRKSNFSYRNGDDMEVTSTSFSPEIFNKHETVITKCTISPDPPKKKLTNEIEIELIKEKVEPTDENDLQKMLNWDDGIGTLPGSKIKFIVNEFNMIEYITEEEYRNIREKRVKKVPKKAKTEFQAELRCLECGCFGLPSEFISHMFCSYDCRDLSQARVKKEKAEKYKKKKKKPKVEKMETDFSAAPKVDNMKEEKLENISEEDSNDNSSQDKFLPYPWSCKKKGFSWSKYLEHIKAKPAPVKLFKDPFPYTRNGFKPGMKLEGVDPQHPSYFCVLTIVEVVGYRIRLHFDGYTDKYDFWCNADSMNIFPVGWCEKYGHVLQPPSAYTVANFNWVQYLRVTRSTAAPKHLFANRAGQAICPNGFRVGMKLEAVDRKNTSLVCVATIRDMMDNRLLVHFDSWDDIYDYWADPTSPYIHPVGWCDQYGHNLTPPNDYPNPESFSWEIYLKETKSVAAPVRAFKQRPACGFKRGMRLECVDRRVPQLIRVATVNDVKEHQIRINFDGWMDKYGYWVDDDSPDIHPMGWCHKTGHPIEPPLTPDDVYDYNLGCQTIGCRGLGHIQGPKYANHSSQEHCPYAEENIDLEKKLPDRLLSPDTTPEAIEPISREPKECRIKPRLGRPPKYLQQLKPEPVEEPPEKKPRKTFIKKLEKPISISVEEEAKTFIEHACQIPAEVESWKRHSRYLQKFVLSESNPKRWSHHEVAYFISQLPFCEEKSEMFRREKVDGEALLSLSQKDIVSILKFRIGPAVKLYNSIVLLRHRADKKLFSKGI